MWVNCSPAQGKKQLITDLLIIKVMFYDVREPSNSALYEWLVLIIFTLHTKNMGI